MLNQILNLMVWLTSIGVNFGESPLNGRAFILSDLDIQKVSPTIKFHTSHRVNE